MKHYLLLPQDRVRILPPEDRGAGCLELCCERTVIFFELDGLRKISLLRGVRVGRMEQRALGLRGPDALLETEYLLLIPETHPDFAGTLAALRVRGPIGEADYRPLRCDQNGHHEE